MTAVPDPVALALSVRSRCRIAVAAVSRCRPVADELRLISDMATTLVNS